MLLIFIAGLVLGLIAWPAVIFALLLWGGHELRKAEREQARAHHTARAI